MNICVDTNAYSLLMQNNKKIREYIEEAEKVFISAIVIGELYAGFQLGSRLKENYEELKQFLSMSGVEIVKIDENIAERYGIILKQLKESGNPIPANDIWIGATAVETGARLLSCDSHFDNIPGLILLKCRNLS